MSLHGVDAQLLGEDLCLRLVGRRVGATARRLGRRTGQLVDRFPELRRRGLQCSCSAAAGATAAGQHTLAGHAARVVQFIRREVAGLPGRIVGQVLGQLVGVRDGRVVAGVVVAAQIGGGVERRRAAGVAVVVAAAGRRQPTGGLKN